MSETLLVRNGIIITLGDPPRILREHSILCEDGVITQIAPSKDFTGGYDRIVDAAGRVVMPGFINAHMHFYSTMVRGLGKAKPSKDFNGVLANLWWRLDKKLLLEDCHYSALVPLIDAVKHGTTTLIDHHASPHAVRGSLNAIADAVGKVGLRASLCYELSDRDGRIVAKEGMEENADFIATCRARQSNQFKALFGLHASFTVGDKTLKKAAQSGHDLGVGFHVHTAEAKSDQDHCLKNHKMRVVERLHTFGILGDRSICAHCVHLNNKEIDLLAKTGTAVAHNPQSNMNNAVGVADVLRMAGRGVLVGLGTDAMTVNMREEVRAALWVRHLAENDPGAGFVETASTLLYNNAAIANRYFDPHVGAIKEGYAADIVLLDYLPPTPLDDGTVLGHFMFGLTQAPVDTTIAAGRILMERKRLLLEIEEDEVAAKSCELAAQLWERF